MLPVDYFDKHNQINRLRRGDVETFNALYWEFHPAIYQNILRITKDKEVAADLLQLRVDEMAPVASVQANNLLILVQ